MPWRFFGVEEHPREPLPSGLVGWPSWVSEAGKQQIPHSSLSPYPCESWETRSMALPCHSGASASSEGVPSAELKMGIGYMACPWKG